MPPKEFLDREQQAGLRRLKIHGWRLGQLPPDQPGNVRHDRAQHGRLIVAERDAQSERAHDVAPHVIRPPRLAEAVPTQHRHALDERPRPDLVE